MPDGNPHEISCNVGHDVTYAKGLLARKTDIAFNRLALYMDGKLMFDPLSFNDFPDIMKLASKEIRVQVQV